VFYINIPFGLAAAAVVGIALVEPKQHSRPVIDYLGAIWLTLAITLLLLVLVESGDPTIWTKPITLVAVAGILIFSALFAWTEQRAPEPIVPFSLFKNRIIGVGSITAFMVGAAMFGALSFIPLYVQGTLGGTATEAGALLTPFLLGWVTMSVVGGRLMFRIGYRPTILAGLVVLVASFGVLATFGSTTPRSWLVGDVLAMGIGMGLVMFALLITVQNSVSRGQLGIATSLNQFSRSIGQTVGVAIMGTVMTISLASHIAEIQKESGLPEADVARTVHNPSALIDPIARAAQNPELLKAMKGALAGALHNVFLTGVAFAVLALLSGFWLPASEITTETKTASEQDQIPRSPAECERMLMAEMTTIDAENEPAMAKKH
jgi:MFS family permease